MTEQEKIEALKLNEKPFKWMDPELKRKAIQICKMFNFYRLDLDGEFRLCSGDSTAEFCDGIIYRLRDGYTTEPAEPEEIELKIYMENGFFNITTNLSGTLYTNAAAFIPKPGFRFAGYRYESKVRLFDKPFYLDELGENPIFPIAAVYRKQRH